MRSPSRRAAAPVEMTRAPSGSPDAISTCAGLGHAQRDGLELRHVAIAREEHAFLALTSTIALAGTTSTFSLCSTVKVTFAYIPGFSRNCALLDLDFDLRRARGRIENRRHVGDAPVEVLAGVGIHETSAFMPGVIRRRSFSTMLATSRTMPMSTTEMNDEFGVTHAPGSSDRLPTKPLTGDEIMVFERLIFSSSRRACACAYCAFARSSCAAAA